MQPAISKRFAIADECRSEASVEEHLRAFFRGLHRFAGEAGFPVQPWFELPHQRREFREALDKAKRENSWRAKIRRKIRGPAKADSAELLELARSAVRELPFQTDEEVASAAQELASAIWRDLRSSETFRAGLWDESTAPAVGILLAKRIARGVSLSGCIASIQTEEQSAEIALTELASQLAQQGIKFEPGTDQPQ